MGAAPASPLSPYGEDSWGGMLAGPAAPSSPPPPVSPQAGAKPSGSAQGMDRGVAAAPVARESMQPRSAAADIKHMGAAAAEAPRRPARRLGRRGRPAAAWRMPVRALPTLAPTLAPH